MGAKQTCFSKTNSYLGKKTKSSFLMEKMATTVSFKFMSKMSLGVLCDLAYTYSSKAWFLQQILK